MNKKRRILIVDSDEQRRNRLGIPLDMLGFAVTQAGGGHEAMRLCEAHGAYDLIVLEQNMPDMDGMQFLHWLRTQKRLQTPVLLLTVAENTHRQIQLFKAGVTEIIFKPFDTSRLLKHVRALLRQAGP